MSNLIIIYITNPSKEAAKKVADHLMEHHLIACANMFPVNSIYRWEGKVRDEEEYVMICKSTEDKYEKIKTEVESIHEYEVPCVVKIHAEGNSKYMDWLRGQL